MRLEDHEATFEGSLRPATILRAGALGELAALLLAAHAMTFGIAWLAVNASAPTGWLMAFVAVWIIARSVGCWSGNLLSVAGTLCAMATTQWVAFTLGEVPIWLSKGPFSPHVITLLLSCLLIVDVCDFPWRWGWTMAELRHSISTSLSKVPARAWGWGALTLFVLYMIIVPAAGVLWEQLWPSDIGSREMEDMSFAEAARLRMTELFTTVWFFAFGASVGSFLNVVVYRTPRRESLVMRRSACPKCGAKIAGKDNLPLIGWIRLHGKCRNCELPISARYPLVEGTTGCLFLLFFFAELLSGGLNLPIRHPNHYAGVVWIIFYTKWDLIGLYLFHCLLLSTLFSWSLIRYDGQRIPSRSIVTALTMMLAPVIAWPGLLLVPMQLPLGITVGSERLEAILTTVAGGLVGCIAGLLVDRLVKLGKSPLEREFAVGLALVGVAMGWQAALSATAITLLIHLIVSFVAPTVKSGWSLTASLFLATIIQLLSWRAQSLYLADWWPVVEVSGISLAIWAGAVVVLLIACAIRRVHEVPASHSKPAAGESPVTP